MGTVGFLISLGTREGVGEVEEGEEEEEAVAALSTVGKGEEGGTVEEGVEGGVWYLRTDLSRETRDLRTKQISDPC